MHTGLDWTGLDWTGLAWPLGGRFRASAVASNTHGPHYSILNLPLPTVNELPNNPKVMGLLESANPLFVAIPKAKTAKIVRTVIEIVSAVPDAVSMQIGLCQQVSVIRGGVGVHARGRTNDCCRDAASSLSIEYMHVCLPFFVRPLMIFIGRFIFNCALCLCKSRWLPGVPKRSAHS